MDRVRGEGTGARGAPTAASSARGVTEFGALAVRSAPSGRGRSRDPSVSRGESRHSESGRQNLNLRPLGPNIDAVLGSFRAQLGDDLVAYRGHAHRVFHFCRALYPGEADEAIAVAAAFHDVGIWADRTFDYLEPSRARAQAFRSPSGSRSTAARWKR